MSNLVVDQTAPALDQELIGKIVRIDAPPIQKSSTPTLTHFGTVSGVRIDQSYHGLRYATIYFVGGVDVRFPLDDKERPYKITTYKPRRIARAKDVPVHV